METLAYLHLTEDYENSEAKEFSLKGLKTAAMVGVIGATSLVGVVGTADSASAYGYGYGGCYSYGCGSYYSYRRPYYPRYYSYRPCSRSHYWY